MVCLIDVMFGIVLSVIALYLGIVHYLDGCLFHQLNQKDNHLLLDWRYLITGMAQTAAAAAAAAIERMSVVVGIAIEIAD